MGCGMPGLCDDIALGILIRLAEVLEIFARCVDAARYVNLIIDLMQQFGSVFHTPVWNL